MIGMVTLTIFSVTKVVFPLGPPALTKIDPHKRAHGATSPVIKLTTSAAISGPVCR